MSPIELEETVGIAKMAFRSLPTISLQQPGNDSMLCQDIPLEAPLSSNTTVQDNIQSTSVRNLAVYPPDDDVAVAHEAIEDVSKSKKYLYIPLIILITCLRRSHN